ncbi:MAG: twitch domain-containing radical SAM protein [Planctomycetota bacterium]|jgi:sulfatase maturation enzyme AslB (radical SAM superfamily)|nr:twitch domain-containing radical SAM protein [Planctomycetota bacterium]
MRDKAMHAAIECLEGNGVRDLFAADFEALSRLWKEVSPDPGLAQYETEYQWLAYVERVSSLKDNTLCPVPWMQQTVRENGMVSVCCGASDEAVLRDDGQPYHILDESSAGDVVNSRFMREIKKTMMAGEWAQVCTGCQVSEETGYSYRTEKQLLFDPEEFHTLVSRTQQDGTSPPVVSGMHYILGNACNIKCRMCGPWASSKWASDAKLVWGDNFPIERFTGQEVRWYERGEAWQDLFDCLPDLRVLQLTGGEPLLIPEMYKLLGRIIETGEAHHVRLIYNTNLTSLPPELRTLWPQFEGIDVSCSIDGFGAVNDYIRHPSQWSDISRNLHELDDHFEEYGMRSLRIGCTVQVYNLLMLKDLVDFLLESNLQHLERLNLCPLHEPEHFNVRILPIELRRLAAHRLVDARESCLAAEAERGVALDVNLEEMARILEEPEHENADLLRREFQRVTVALDQHRKENVLDVIPELAAVMNS